MGDRPWDHPWAKKLGAGREDLLELLVDLCEEAISLGLLPHTNAGILEEEELRMLAPYNASMGLMLETTALVRAHQGSPGKQPGERIAHIALAGRLKIPFTTGIMVGIGEGICDRKASLRVISRLHQRYGHIQEVIIQGFDPKLGTPMARASPPSLREMVQTVRLARSILPSSIAVQVPPNLSSPLPLVEAGASDLGGISPVTPDWINPNHPWPTPKELCRQLKDYQLRERLPIYPFYVKMGWFGEKTKGLIKNLAGPDGLRF
jgi:FO synthase subunit 1